MRIFVSQIAMDVWMQRGGISLEGEMMRFHALPQLYLYVTPAVTFERIDGADSDPLDVIGSVRTQAELAQMNADHYESSVVVGEFAYTVKQGFLATPLAADGTEAHLDGAWWGSLLHAIESLGVA